MGLWVDYGIMGGLWDYGIMGEPTGATRLICVVAPAVIAPAATFVVFNTKFLVFDTQLLVFNAQFLVFDTKFITFTHLLKHTASPGSR